MQRAKEIGSVASRLLFKGGLGHLGAWAFLPLQFWWLPTPVCSLDPTQSSQALLCAWPRTLVEGARPDLVFFETSLCKHWPPFGRRLAAVAMWVNNMPQLPKRGLCRRICLCLPHFAFCFCLCLRPSLHPCRHPRLCLSHCIGFCLSLSPRPSLCLCLSFCICLLPSAFPVSFLCLNLCLSRNICLCFVGVDLALAFALAPGPWPLPWLG